MLKTVISDTSCFIVLSKINRLELLRELYGKIYTTSVIAEEFGEPLPEWVIVEDVKELDKQRILETQIDKGESSAIALALENKDTLVILDDYKARKLAVKLGLQITGTLGIIAKAKLLGKITSVKPVIAEIKNTNFRISAELELLTLQQAKEI